MSPIMPSNFGGAPNAIGVSDEIVICQIYFKPGHCIDVCQYRFNEDFVPLPPRIYAKGKGPKSGYVANFEALHYLPPYMPSYNEYMNGISPAYMPGFNFQYSPRATYIANFEAPADESWYLDSRAIHHRQTTWTNMQIRE